jgi:Starch-binding associating with outer membrane
MKKYIKIIVLGSMMATFSSCQTFLDVNTDPTLKSDVTLQELLPTALFYTGETSYRQSYITCQYTQQIGSATSAGSLDAQDDTDNAQGWVEMYLNVLPHCNIMVEKAKALNAPAYEGIAKVLLAYNLGIATTCWENIPYSTADKKDFAPAYDTQEQIYQELPKLLDAAIVSLAQNSGAKPAADDLVYKGDLAKWTRLAYTLKARFAMHLTKKNAVQNANAALTALQNGMKSNDDDFQLLYNSRNLGPWYSRVALSNNTGNLSITHCATLINFMNGSATFPVVDPRLPFIATLRRNQTAYNGTRPGANQGATVDFSTTSWHSGLNSPVQFCTYAEAKAIEAEARFIANGGTITSKGSNQAAYDAYLEIARANMSRLGVTTAAATTYLAAKQVAVGATALTLTDIMREKYKAMFLMGDIWTDFRRYNYLFLTYPENPNLDLAGKTIQRILYPLSESTRNSKVYQANFKAMGETMWMFK